MEVAAKRPGQFEAGVSFDFEVSGTGNANPREEAAIPLISGILMALIFLLIGINLILGQTSG